MAEFDQVALVLLILVPLGGSLAMMFMSSNQSKDSWHFAIFISGISLCLA